MPTRPPGRRALPLLSALLLAAALLGCAGTALPVKTTHQFRQVGHRWAEGARDPQGFRVGSWVFFDADGELRARGSFKRGQMHGTWTFWFGGGEVRTLQYANGERVTPFISWN